MQELRILLVQDNLNEYNLLDKLRIQNCELEYKIANSIDNIVYELKHNHWDIVISYYSCGEFTAFQVISTIKNSFIDMPIIVILDKSQEENIVKLIKQGCSNCVKESNLELLEAILEREFKVAMTKRNKGLRLDKRNFTVERNNLKIIFENSLLGMININKDALVKRANKTFLNMMGRTLEEVLGKTVGQVLDCCICSKCTRCTECSDNCNLCELRKRLNNFLTSKENRLDFQWSNLIKVNDALVKRWYNIRYVPIIDSEEENILVIVEDISDRKSFEESLINSETKYKSLFYNMVDAFAHNKIIFENNRPVDIQFVEVNNSFENLFNVKSVDVIGKSCSELFPLIFEKVISELQAYYTGNKKNEKMYIDEVYCEKNSKWLTISAFESQKGYIAAIVSDVTENRMAQVKLQSSEEKYRSLFMNMHSAVSYNKIILDKKGKPIDFEYVEINDFFAKTLGLTKSEMERKKFSEICSRYSHLHEEMITLVTDVALNGKVIYNEDFYSEIFKGWYCRTIYSPEKYYFVLMLTDINHRKKFEEELIKAKQEAEEANKAKSSFLANMSHEIRTPLNGMLGLIDLTLRSNLSKEDKENLNTAKLSGKSLLKVINDILDFSKVEAGKLSIENVHFDFHESINYIIKPHIIAANSKKINLKLMISNEVPKFLFGDSIRLKQVIDNLLSNAIKFTDKGTVKLEIELIKRINDSIEIQVSVSDTGIGILETEKKYLFQSFSQVDGSYTRKFSGTGLGLAISKQLVEKMGGSIFVESTKGAGSVFRFTSKLKVSEEKVYDKEAKETFVKIDSTSLRVLLVEDDTVNQLVISEILKSVGHGITIANNGKEALELLQQNQYDIIFMDIEMPLMNGITATKFIREKEELSKNHVPVIAITAHALKGDREKFLRYGMDDYISKPIDIENFYKVLNKFSSKSIENKILKYIGINRFDDSNPAEITEKNNYNIIEVFRELEKNIREKDLDAIEKNSNNLKELSNKLEMNQIKKLAFKIQLAGRRKDYDEIIKNMKELKTKFHSLVKQ
ncbi:response regulator [Clostridium magnum]|uniref:Circadian input-output histidine kinase CikA n=1 Tax=Clostridium magnum DSM 2767 TaxID=1121326 RepID=A0A162T7P3_9CLOT|nr:response regulator [Clostridium magnum]KZL92331.1 sensory/regulatory protein RpfC [Clostridium magnum DSM 2767]SHH13094.1 PAS domain-containing protein [Clostridium magnum DSM 2767]